MPSRDPNDLAPDVRALWEQSLAVWVAKYPDLPQPFLTCTWRSNREQDELYAQGRTKPGAIVTHAKAGQSNHNTHPSPAFDIAFKGKDGKVDWREGLFSKFALIAENAGLAWGGKWSAGHKDTPHFERKGLS